MTKDSLIKGTLILTAAAFVARFLGLVQRIPLKHLLGDSGMGTYGIAYNIYFILFTVATAGLPSAVAKLVAEKMETGREAEAERIFQAAVWFALVSGLIFTVFLYFYAPWQASFSKDPSAVGPIRAIAPSLLLFPLAAVMRGYFQGRQHMLPNGLSQIFEQILRVLTAILLAYMFISIGWGQTWAVTGASFGGVAGTIGAIVVMFYFFIRMRKSDRAAGLIPSAEARRRAAQIPYKSIYKTLFAVAVPVVLFACAVPAINWIDSSIIKPLIINQVGDDKAQEILGQLTGRAQSLAGLPIVLAIAISQSIVPIISSSFARKDMRLVSSQTERAMRLAILSGLYMLLIVATAARPLNSLAFGDPGGTDLVIILTYISIFQSTMQTSGAIMMGIGTMKPLVGHVIIGLVAKIAVSYIFAPFIGVYGVNMGTAVCFILMAWLNDRTLKRRIPGYRIFNRDLWLRLGVVIAVVSGIGFLLESLVHYLIHIPYRIDFFLQSAIVCSAVALLYPLMLGVTRVVTKDDIRSYPASVQRLISKVSRMVGVRL
ncbi:putative polysaccharide biosynthesis protein [Gorillibacterium massiliense]|uniref:putative polysaccharide biosynthesis protein n=1 Tax=Gorillibacterium massiliense TaxID=1280390 RepID=UPI0005930E61|nr:polysaccharide biosynthesis protein [Gorillibacterium massiliense]